jgi:hypothetical protein
MVVRTLYLGWEAVEMSCHLAATAKELGDKDLAKLYRAAAFAAGVRVGASHRLVARMARGAEERQKRSSIP